jgi:SAM-dependent methyltransferase
MSDRGASGVVCPSCGSPGTTFYELEDVPVHQVKLVRSRAEALNCVKGDIRMAFCPGCGFVWNAAFDVELMQYQEDYESTQAVSPTFNRFHDHLARDLIERFDLHGKKIVELGCGQGEFITMLAEYGDNRGYGFDRVIRDQSGSDRVRFVKDFYGPRYSDLQPDFVVCKMTLEHVHDVHDFIRRLRATVDRPETVVFFMIPEITRILNLAAFWDIYYEHCSYFSPGSLARAFRRAGFDPIEVWTDYADQYVLIAARPGHGERPLLANEEPPGALLPKVESFPGRVAKDRERWLGLLRESKAAGKRTVLWGGGSKGVAFLTTVGVTKELLSYVVDVNPRRNGTYIAGTGHQIVAPEFLKEYRPDEIVVMSPIYIPEIKAQLGNLGVHPDAMIPVAEAP